MTVTNNSVEQINTALLSLIKKIDELSIDNDALKKIISSLEARIKILENR